MKNVYPSLDNIKCRIEQRADPTSFTKQKEGFEVEYYVGNYKKLKVGSEEGQIFKCSLHTNGLEYSE